MPIAVDRARLQERLDAVSNTQTSSSAEVVTLKQRVEETEREKRDLMGVVSRLQEDAAQRDSESGQDCIRNQVDVLFV